MSRDNFDGEQAPIRKAFSDFRKAQEQELARLQAEGGRAKDALVDLCNQAVKFPAPRLLRAVGDARARAKGGGGTMAGHDGRHNKDRMVDEEEGDDEDDDDEDDDPHLAFLKGPRRVAEMGPETAAVIPRSHGTVEMRRFVKLFTADRQPVVNRGTPMDRCRWAQTSTGLDLNFRRWEVVRSVLSQSMQHDEGRSERDSLRIVLKDVLNSWDASTLRPQMVLNDAFVFQPFTVHAVGPINELRFLPGEEHTGAFLLTEKAGPDQAPPHHHVLGVGIGYVSPVNAVNTEFAPYRAAVGLNVFELHPHAGRFRPVLKLQAVFTPSQLGSVQVDWGFIAQYTPVPTRSIEFPVPVDRTGTRFVHGATFSRDGEPFSWKDDAGRLPDGTDVLGYTGEGDTVRSKMHTMLSRLPMIELAAKILMFRVPAEVKTDLFRMYTRHRAGPGGGDDWPVFATMPCVGPFLLQQLKLMYHAHLLKLAVYVLTMDCMRMSEVFGPDNADHPSARGVFAKALYVLSLSSPPSSSSSSSISAEEFKQLLDEDDAAPRLASLKRNWGKMVQSVMHMWHTTLGTFPFGGSNQKFCTSEDYYKTVFGLESVLDALVKLHYILSCEGPTASHYPRPRATIAEISAALKAEVSRRIHGDEEKLKFIRSKIIGEMTVGKPRFNEGKKPRRDPLDFLGIHDLIRTDATGDLRSASLQLPMSLKSVSVRFDLGHTLGRFLPYWRGIQTLYLPSGACFGITREDLRTRNRMRGEMRKKKTEDRDDDDWCWSANDCCATGACVDPLHMLNHALHQNAHARLRQLMNRHHDAQSAEMSAEDEPALLPNHDAKGEDDDDDEEEKKGRGREALRLGEERRSFLLDSVTMKQFNTQFLRHHGAVGGAAAVDYRRYWAKMAQEEAESPEGLEEGSVVELPLSVSGKVLKCVVNTSFVPPAASFSSSSSYPRMSNELPSSSSNPFSSSQNPALKYITGMVKLLASQQGLLPPPPERLAR